MQKIGTAGLRQNLAQIKLQIQRACRASRAKSERALAQKAQVSRRGRAGKSRGLRPPCRTSSDARGNRKRRLCGRPCRISEPDRTCGI